MSDASERGYGAVVVAPGDDLSEYLRQKCQEANQDSYAAMQEWLRGDEIVVGDSDAEVTEQTAKLETDGTGTKIRIYARQFEILYQQVQEQKCEESDIEDECIDLWERMWCDLFGMIVDDFREGQIPVAVSNMLVINQLHRNKNKSDFFGRTLGEALSRTIKASGVANLAGESAIHGEPDSYTELKEGVGGLVDGLESADPTQDVSALRQRISRRLSSHVPPGEMEKVVGDTLSAIAESLRTGVGDIAEKIEDMIAVDAGGSGIGVSQGERLTGLKPGQVIIGLQETPTESGVRGIRANGLTSVRNLLNEVLGRDWTNLTLNEAIEALKNTPGYEGKAETIRLEFGEKFGEHKTWDVITGKTTMFVPTISRHIIAEEKRGDQKVSKLIHVTGNPAKKIASAVKGTELDVEINMTGMPFSQGMRIYQILSGKSDAEILESMNAGIPYAMIVEEDAAENIIEDLAEQGITALKVGRVSEKSGEEAQMRITNLGHDNSTVEKSISECLK